ncbi:MAG: DUF4139 domain-containing protein [Campylobacterota bacterium]|nr:DUF4139 domain-containing protein [Campylobacterota bacterium]
MLLRISSLLSFSSLMLLASSLDIYSDRSFYTYQPTHTFIGFNSGVIAKNETGTLELSREVSCEHSSKLCRENAHIRSLHVKLTQGTKEQALLDKLIAQYRPESIIDADATIQTATKIASRMATLEQETQSLKKEIKKAKAQFSKHAPSQEALFYTQKPMSEVTLSIKNGLYFQSEYLLDIDKETLEHTLLLTNRSGIDIKADEIKLFAKSAGRISAPIAFYPRKIRISQPKVKRAMVQKEMAMMANVAAAPQALHVSKTATRSYRMKNVTLPSDGKQKRLPVNSEKLTISSKLTWHPYHSNYVYHTASFTPSQSIESQQWKIRRHHELIENAPIRKEGKKILANVAIEYDLETKRENITDFSEDKGIFSSDRLKKEGFKLTLTNRSNRAKSVEIIERIPLSTQEEIQVTLEKLDLAHQFDKKSGKLSMRATIEAGKSKVIEVHYAIRYPKETKIYY